MTRIDPRKRERENPVTNTFAHTHTHTRRYIYIYTILYIHIIICIYTHTHTHTYTHIYIYIYTHIHTYKHTYMIATVHMIEIHTRFRESIQLRQLDPQLSQLQRPWWRCQMRRCDLATARGCSVFFWEKNPLE